MSSSDDDDTSDESDWEITQDVEQQLNVAQLDTNCEQVEWASRRLAACNLDWDMFKAEDIYILVNSFVPTGGDVTNVAIYLSDFGKEKLEVEESLGPRIQVDHLNQNDEMDPTDLKVEFAVRKYNIEKLKYYYAIIECDSETTATKIYENCDGMLFENSGLKMDLRFVPDDMEFDEDRIKEKMQKDDINLKRYKPKTSMKSAATRTGTDIKWDDEDYERKQMVQEAFNDDYDAKNTMMADSDSEDDATVENRRNALLSLIEEKPKKSDLKIEWDDQKEASDSDDEDIEKALAKRAEGHSSDEESPSKALKTEGTKKSGYKAYLEKSKERRKEKKLRLRQSKQQVGTDVDEFEGPQKKKARSRADLKSTDYGTATAVLADERFSALVTDSAFTIEQTNKHAKGTKLIELQVQAKKAAAPATKKEESLVDSLKSKSAKWTSKKRK